MENDKKLALLDKKTFEQIIKESGLTQEEYAEEIGVSDRYIRKLQSENKNISVALAYNISKSSGYPIESLLTTASEIVKANETKYKAQYAEVFHSLKNDFQTVYGMEQVLRLKYQKMNVGTDIFTPIILELQRIIIRLNELLQQNFVDSQLCRTSLNRIILNWAETQKPKLTLHNIQLETKLAADLPDISLDKQHITQLLLNCIDNSMSSILEKKINNGKILITTHLDNAKKQILLKIIDNGLGLTPEQQANFFKPHYTTKATGTGLGTTLTQAIVKMHDGAISVSGTPGQGCCICIGLPLQISKSFSNEDYYTEIAKMLF